MKILNNIKLLMFCLVAASLFTACEEDVFPRTQDGSTLFEIGGAVPYLLDSSPGFFDLADPASATNSFSTAIAGETATSGDVSVSYSGAAGTLGPVSMGSVSIPENVTYSLADVTSALGITLDDVAVGDAFSFQLTAGQFKSVSSAVLGSCFSLLAGTYEASTTVLSTGAGIGWDDCAGETWTGQVRFDNDGAGNYTFTSIDADGVEWPDISMGAYFACYATADAGSLPGGDLLVKDVCSTLAYQGASQWGEVYSFNKLDSDGATLTIGWSNDYGEAGETVLTRAEGEWPVLSF